jgi:hypothetical protein
MSVGSFALWFALAGFTFLSLKHAARGTPSAVIGRGSSTVFEIPENAFPRFALMASAMRLEKPFTILHAPAHFVDLAFAYVISQKPFWFPDSLGPAIWQCITYPLFGAPAWFFVGRGIDRLRRGIRTPRSEVIVGAVLFLFFAVIAAVLRFALADDPGLVPGRVEGFTLWTLLFAIPVFAWSKRMFARPVS